MSEIKSAADSYARHYFDFHTSDADEPVPYKQAHRAFQQAERNLDAKIAQVENENADLRAQLDAATKRMEEAERRACLGHMREGCNYLSGCNVICNKCGHKHEPTLTFPIPPADVAELRRTIEKLREGVKTIPEYMQMVQEQRQRIAELERKLAEQQAAMAHAYVTLSACEESAEPNHGVAETVRILSKVDCTELEVLTDKAREEGRKEAVPEGWQVVPKVCTEEMRLAACRHYESDDYTGTTSTYAAMLATAPSPASLNAKEGGE